MTCQRSPGFSLVFVVTCSVCVSHSYFGGSADPTDKGELCVPAELGGTFFGLARAASPEGSLERHWRNDSSEIPRLGSLNV